jgi:hypothetical protein
MSEQQVEYVTGNTVIDGAAPIRLPMPNDLHVWNHRADDAARVSVKAERNSKGWNYEASVSGARTVEEAMALLQDATTKLQAAYNSAV